MIYFSSCSKDEMTIPTDQIETKELKRGPRVNDLDDKDLYKFVEAKPYHGNNYQQGSFAKKLKQLYDINIPTAGLTGNSNCVFDGSLFLSHHKIFPQSII